MTKYYLEAIGSKDSDSGPYWWKVYTYDATGTKERIHKISKQSYHTRQIAINAGLSWFRKHDFSNVEIRL